MILLPILFSILQNTACDHLQKNVYTQDRFILRKLLEDSTSTDVTTSATTTAYVTTSQRNLYAGRNSLAVLQVVDAHGLVQHKISTNQNIRLRVKALTTPDYQSPFVKQCWYNQFERKPSNHTEPSKTLEFLDNGCAKEGGMLLDGNMVPFMENGVLETQSEIFSLMPLFYDNFTFLGIHCDVVLCHQSEDCYFTCTNGQSKWRMDTSTKSIELSTLIEVRKVKATTPAPTPKPVTKKERNLNDYLIRSGKDRPPGPFLRRTTERPFLDKNQSYFTVSTLGVCVLLLLLLVGAGCTYISYRNNRETSKVEVHTSGHLNGYIDNKMTGLPNILATNPNCALNSRNIVTSQSPENSNVSAWPASDFNPRSPCFDMSIVTTPTHYRTYGDFPALMVEEDPRCPSGHQSYTSGHLGRFNSIVEQDRETAVLTPSEAAVLEARRLIRASQNPQRMSSQPSQHSLQLQPSQRRHALETEHREYHGETGNGRINRYSPMWNEVPEHYRDRDDIVTSPVGGELYKGSRVRSPSSEPLIQKSPFRGRMKATSLLSMALNDYFDKYGM